MKFHALKKTFFLYYLYTTNFIWEPKYRDWAGNLIFKYSLVKDGEIAVDRQASDIVTCGPALYRKGGGCPPPPSRKNTPRLIAPPKNQPPAKRAPSHPPPFDPFPQSEPQKRKKRFNRRRSRSAEQIVMIFTSNYSSQQPWLHPLWTDKIFVKKTTKPANCPKNRRKPSPNNTPPGPSCKPRGNEFHWIWVTLLVKSY